MDVVFLDQNKWIELAKVEAGRGTPELIYLSEQLASAVKRKLVVFPLTESVIVETSKRNDLTSRRHVATAQAKFSEGFVFRSRKARLVIEFRHAVQRIFGHTPVCLPENWAIVPGFMQAFSPFDEMVAAPGEAARTRLFNVHISPKDQYLDFMLNQDDKSRRLAHEFFATDSKGLVSRIELRRRALGQISADLRRRVYAARLFYDHQDYVASVLQSIGRTSDELKALGPEAIVGILENVPTLNVESKIAAKLEAQQGEIHVNDIRDMSSFCAAVPYAKLIVAEKIFVALSTQAKLHTQYNTKLTTSLNTLANVYI
jgi:hypothetical protein